MHVGEDEEDDTEEEEEEDDVEEEDKEDKETAQHRKPRLHRASQCRGGHWQLTAGPHMDIYLHVVLH